MSATAAELSPTHVTHYSRWAISWRKGVETRGAYDHGAITRESLESKSGFGYKISGKISASTIRTLWRWTLVCKALNTIHGKEAETRNSPIPKASTTSGNIITCSYVSKVLTEVNSTKHCLEWMVGSVQISQTDVLTIIIGTTVLLLTVRQSRHDWRPARSQEEARKPY